MNLSKQDLAEIVLLDKECMGSEVWSEKAWAELDWSNSLLLLHESKQAFILFSVLAGDDTAHLLKIAVREKYRGQGLSRQLFLQALGPLTSQGFSKIYLEVASENDIAVGLYGALGFKIVHKCRNFIKMGVSYKCS
jgi:ribosomal protein S18 acetylase RimI-like enzyme